MKPEHTGTAQNEINRTETGQSKGSVRLPKTHQGYWSGKLKKRSYVDGTGQRIEIPEWQVRIQHLGRESWFNLHTTNKAAAAVKARDIYLSLLALGWDATLAKFKPETTEKVKSPTIGEFLDEVSKKSGVKAPTFAIYARKFRTLVAGAMDLPSNISKHDYVGDGYKKWLETVHSVKLSRMTPAKVQEWKVGYIKDAGANPLAQKRARVSVNSIMRSAKALFSPKVTRFLSIELPSPLPFEGVEFEKVGTNRYKSEVNPQLLFAAAQRELRDGDGAADDSERADRKEQFKIFVLGLGAGLRRDEIDTLAWKQVNFETSRVRVETNAYTSAKSADSEEEVDIDESTLEILRGFKKGSASEFVVNSDVKPRPSTTYHHYRCQRHFDGLIDWLRSKGITARNPIHALRKEFGSLICAQGGIYAASVQLRHSDIRITRDSYLDRKERVVVKLGFPNEPTLLQKTA